MKFKGLLGLFIVCLILPYFSTAQQRNSDAATISKSIENPYGSPDDETLPEWARQMYGDNPNVLEVYRLFNQYYKTHKYKKNQHTQWYKHWMKTVDGRLDRDGFIELLPEEERIANETRFLNESKALKMARSGTGLWKTIGPTDFDRQAASRSHAPGHAHNYTVEKSKSDANVLYSGTETAGVWKTTDNGLNWVNMTRDMPVGKVRGIEIDHTTPDIVYFNRWGEGIYKSIDGGLNWTKIGGAILNAKNHYIMDLVMHPTNNQILYAASDEGLYRTLDGGNNWTIQSGGDFKEVEFHPTNSDMIYAIRYVNGDRTEFMKSTDGGNSFLPRAGGWPTIDAVSSSTLGGFHKNSATTNGKVSFANVNLGDATYPDFTVEMYIKQPETYIDKALFGNKNWNSGANKGWVIANRWSNGKIRFNIADNSTRIDLDGVAIGDNQWHHVAAVYRSTGTKELYIDGELKSSSTTNLTDDVATTGVLNLGADGFGNWDETEGSFAQVRIWTTALSSTTINDWLLQDVNATHPDYADLLHYWKLDETSGTTATDSKGTNHGTASDDYSWSPVTSVFSVTPATAYGENKRTEIAVSPAAPNKVFALMAGAVNGGSGLYGFYVSEDMGETWTHTCCGTGPGGPADASNRNMLGYHQEGLDEGGQYYYDLGLCVDPTNADTIHVAGIGHWISGDGGITWVSPAKWSHGGSDDYIHADIQDIFMYMNGSVKEFWAGTDGGIFYSTEQGYNNTRRSNGIAGTDFWGFGMGHRNGELMYGGTYHNSGLLKNGDTYNNGWISCDATGDGVRGYVNPIKMDIVYGDQGKAQIPTDRTTSFIRSSFDKRPNASASPYKTSDLAFDPRCYNHIYSGVDGVLWKTEDDGASWEMTNDFASFGDFKVTSIEIAWTNPDVLYVVLYNNVSGDDKIVKTTDAGASWVEITPSNATTNNNNFRDFDITVSSTDENTLWMAIMSSNSSTNGYKVFETTDGGTNWTNISDGTNLDGQYPLNIKHVRGSNNGLYLGTDNAVYYRNATTPWTLYNNELPANFSSFAVLPYYWENKVRNGGNRSVYEAPMFEYTPPSAQICADRLESFCSRDTIYFSDYSAVYKTGAAWQWTFPGGTPATSTDRDPKVIYSTGGTYNVTLQVTDSLGTHTQTISDFITIDSQCDVDTIPEKALSLAGGGSDYLSIPALNLNSNTVTFSTWIKPNGIQNGSAGIIFTRGGNTTAGINFRSDNQLGYHWNDGQWSWNSGLYAPEDEWSHVVLVIEPTRATMYLNGVAAVNNSTHNIEEFDAATRFGADPSSSSRRFNGLMDEVCIWDRALTQEEVRETRHLTKKPSEDPNLVAYYQFNRADGLATDRSGIRHGSFVGNSTRVVSTTPVGGGESHRMSVTDGGIKQFEGTGLTLEFPATGTYPNGELVITRINLSPDQLPNANNNSRSYWVINNYGTNNTFSELTSIQFEKVGEVTAADALDPTTFKLYKRADNKDGATWATSIDDGDVAIGGTDGSVTFSANNGITSFSQFVVMNEGGTSLPVELLDFQARLQDNRSVKLSWETANEVNNDFFTIERSEDGIDFSALMDVATQGNGITNQTYSAIDNKPFMGINYYRLKQVDVDGSFKYSEIRQVELTRLPNGIVVYPNPTDGKGTIVINSDWEEELMITLFDATGKKVLQKAFFKDTQINLNGLAGGIYVYRINGEGFIKNGRIIIQ